MCTDTSRQNRSTTVTTVVAKECHSKIAETASDLDELLHEIDDKLRDLILQVNRTSDSNAELQRLREERDDAQLGVRVCQEASQHLSQTRVNVFEDVSAAQDARQAIVSTSGDVICAKRVSAGVGATQVLGTVSDASFQLLLRSRDEDGYGQTSVREVVTGAIDRLPSSGS